jgi:hypothetical protein
MSTRISGSRDTYPSQHGAFHSCMVSTPTHNDFSTMYPSLVRGNPYEYSSTSSDHATFTPNFLHHYHRWGKTEEEIAHTRLPPQFKPPYALCEREGHPIDI